MSSLAGVKLENLDITGTFSVQECKQRIEDPSSAILLMGPTGAGKSSFIEALGGDNLSLSKISSSGLEGCTQHVTAYQVTGTLVRAYRRPLYILDTPGFADPKISELDIVSSIRQWWKDNHHRYFDQIMYLTPVNNVRMPGSQRRVLNTFKELTGRDGAGMVTIVTTMWDRVGGEQASRRAERNFEQLRDEVWKAFIDAGSHITKFHNTQESALQVLDQAARKQSNITDLERFSSPMNTHAYAANLRDDLISRMHTLHIQKDLLDTELDDPSIESNQALKSTLKAELEEATRLIAKFQTQMDNFSPPSPPKSTVQTHPNNFAPLPTSTVQDPSKTGRRERAMQSIKTGIQKVFGRDARH